MGQHDINNEDREQKRKAEQNPKKEKSFISSFNYAVEGLIYSLLSQNNMRAHYIFAVIVVIGMLFFDLTRVEFALVFISIAMVVTAELINTAIESAVDLVTKEHHPLAKIAKDVAAGAVVVTAVNALVVGYLVFYNKINPITLSVLTRIRRQEIHLSFVGLLLILILVVGLKTYTKTGTPFQGGQVSGHSALGFGLATTISLLSQNTLIATMAFFMAVMISQSRIEGKIHTTGETVIGALLGIMVMIIIFQVFKI